MQTLRSTRETAAQLVSLGLDGEPEDRADASSRGYEVIFTHGAKRENAAVPTRALHDLTDESCRPLWVRTAVVGSVELDMEKKKDRDCIFGRLARARRAAPR